MKKIKFENAFFIASFFLASSFSLWFYFQGRRAIGDISFQSELGDNPNLKLCPNDRVYQYYSVGTSYKGERGGLRSEIFNQLKTLENNDSTFSGYITARFLVNCEGQVGRIRVKSTDSNFKECSISTASNSLIIRSIKKIACFNPGKSTNGKTVNSYFQINFIIEKGRITDVF